MAIQKTSIIEIYGKTLEFENAYHRIESLERNNNEITIKVASYDFSKDHTISINYFNYIILNDEDNSIKRGYSFLKTLPQFEGAFDV